MLAFLQIQHGVVYYLLAPLLILLMSYQFSAKAFYGIVLCSFSVRALPGPPVMSSGSLVGTTRTFGARSIVGIRTVSGLISAWSVVLGGIIISASGGRAQAPQIFRFR